MTPLFITSTGTGIGKTLVTTSLCWQLRQKGKNVTALKPIISGYNAADLTNDTAQILASCGIEPTQAQQERISPWRYQTPLAPNMAAHQEGHPVDLNALLAFCLPSPSPPEGEGGERDNFPLANRPIVTPLPKPGAPNPLPQGEREYLLIEGVGGIMAPINDHHTVLDWMEALEWPVLLTAGTYLGSISHTLSAMEVLKAKELDVRALIVCESEKSAVPLADAVSTLESFLPVDFPVVKIPRLVTKEAIWKQTPPIDWLCQTPFRKPMKNPKT